MAILMYAVSLGIFIMGYVSTGTNKNLLTIVAVLGILPASKRAVSVVMYARAGCCSDILKSRVEGLEGKIRMMYDLYLTAYDKNYQISCMVIRNRNVVAVSENPKTDLKKGENHIAERLACDGVKDVTVKLFGSNEVDKFVKRACELSGLEDETTDLNNKIANTVANVSL